MSPEKGTPRQGEVMFIQPAAAADRVLKQEDLQAANTNKRYFIRLVVTETSQSTFNNINCHCQHT